MTNDQVILLQNFIFLKNLLYLLTNIFNNNRLITKVKEILKFFFKKGKHIIETKAIVFNKIKYILNY